MEPDKLAQVRAHAQAIAALLYEETDPQQVQTLEGIEEAVRGHILEHVAPCKHPRCPSFNLFFVGFQHLPYALIVLCHCCWVLFGTFFTPLCQLIPA